MDYNTVFLLCVFFSFTLIFFWLVPKETQRVYVFCFSKRLFDSNRIFGFPSQMSLLVWVTLPSCPSTVSDTTQGWYLDERPSPLMCQNGCLYKRLKSFKLFHWYVYNLFLLKWVPFKDSLTQKKIFYSKMVVFVDPVWPSVNEPTSCEEPFETEYRHNL